MLDTNITTVCNARESVAEEYTAYLLCSSLFGRVSLTDDGVEEKFTQRRRQEEQEHTRTGSVKGAERKERGTCVLLWFNGSCQKHFSDISRASAAAQTKRGTAGSARHFSPHHSSTPTRSSARKSSAKSDTLIS